MTTRREFIKKTGYAAPVVLTLSAQPSFAKNGSGRGAVRNRLGGKLGATLRGHVGRPGDND